MALTTPHMRLRRSSRLELRPWSAQGPAVDIRTLRYFVAAAETENLSRAAEHLNVVQSAVSHQLRRLEDELGVKLFTRRGRSVQLSEIGKTFLDDARAVLEAVRVAKHRALLAAQGAVGELHVGFETNSSRSLLMSEALLAFREGFPDVSVRLSPMASESMLEAIASTQIDAGFVYVSEVPPQLCAMALQRSDWVLALPRDHRLANSRKIFLKDLENEGFIWRPRSVSPEIYDGMISACEAGGLIPHIVQEAYNEIMMINLVAGGLGLCFVVDAMSRHWPGELVIFRRVEDFSFPLQLSMVWRTDNEALTLPHLISIVTNLALKPPPEGVTAP